jgi:hypothetical protein
VTGINTVIYYAPTIVEFTGVNSSSGAILAAVGAINVGLAFLGGGASTFDSALAIVSLMVYVASSPLIFCWKLVPGGQGQTPGGHPGVFPGARRSPPHLRVAPHGLPCANAHRPDTGRQAAAFLSRVLPAEE